VFPAAAALFGEEGVDPVGVAPPPSVEPGPWPSAVVPPEAGVGEWPAKNLMLSPVPLGNEAMLASVAESLTAIVVDAATVQLQ